MAHYNISRHDRNNNTMIPKKVLAPSCTLYNGFLQYPLCLYSFFMAHQRNISRHDGKKNTMIPKKSYKMVLSSSRSIIPLLHILSFTSRENAYLPFLPRFCLSLPFLNVMPVIVYQTVRSREVSVLSEWK